MKIITPSNFAASALALAVAACAGPAAETVQPADAKPEAAAAVAKAAAPAALAEAPPLPGEEVLSSQPALAPLADFAAPIPTLIALPNGLRIYLVSRPGMTLESVALVVKRGATADPAGQAGLASLATSMLETGAGGKSQAEIAEAVDALGASLRAEATTDATLVSISGMPDRMAKMVALLSDIALRPTLAEAEWKKLQARRIAELEEAVADPNHGASVAFAAAIFGDTPLGHPALGTPASVQAATLAEVKQLISSYSPAECALIAAGGAPADEVVASLTAAFGGWKGAGRAAAGKLPDRRAKPGVHDDHLMKVAPPAAIALAGLPASERPRFVFVDFKDRPQTVLRVGSPAVPRSSTDVLALRLFNSVLGGSFTSRLSQNLREAHGYTYGAASNFAFGRGPGPFAVGTSVKTAVTGAALAETIKELDRALQEPYSDAEMAKGKALMAYGLVALLQYSDGIAAAMTEIFVDDLPLDEYATFVPRLRALTAADVLAAAKRTLKESEMTIAMAGDEAAVLPQLAAAGVMLPAPELRDALGEKIGNGKDLPAAAKR